jgi:hypothetical protein
MTRTADTFVKSILRKTGLFSDLQLDQILAADRSDGNGITGVVSRLGITTEEQFLRKIGELLGFTYTNLADIRPSDEALNSLPARAVYQYNVG